MSKVTPRGGRESYRGVKLGKTMTIRLPEKVDKLIREVAKETDTSTSYHIRRALEVYFDEGYVDSEIAELRDEQGYNEKVSLEDAKHALGLKKEIPTPINRSFDKKNYSLLRSKLRAISDKLEELTSDLPDLEDDSRDQQESVR